jgi:hypothetical protein
MPVVYFGWLEKSTLAKDNLPAETSLAVSSIVILCCLPDEF